MSHAPYLSIIVPSYDNQSTIEKALKAIRESTYQDYELIVVDCGSQDATPLIAAKFTDKIIELKKGSRGRSHARTTGIKAARGRIIVNIDSDIVIKPDTLVKITDYFSKHQDIDALTGLLSKGHPHINFFSQYKNLYMHYIFKKLPEKVTFLYGSIHALRHQSAQLYYDSDIKIADDTVLGQKLISHGRQIAFLKDLEVVHLKKYDLFSFIKNDFQIPFDWAKIFLRYKGWKQLGRYKTGYAHSPKEQIISVVSAPLIILLNLAALFGYFSFSLILFLVLAWFFLNLRFLAYLTKERGLIFGILAFFVTFLDNIVMALGILCGFTAIFVPGIKKR